MGMTVQDLIDKLMKVKDKRVAMNVDDRDYLLDKLESVLHDTHCQQYKDEICEAFSKYITTESVPDLKPFDLNAAKAGKPVCTRDGRKARIICFDAKCNLPIIALITQSRGDESLASYKSNGGFTNLNESEHDLMMLPEKRSGWVNVYNNSTTHNIYTSADVFESKEIAEEQGTQRNRIAICKITWEE